MQWLMISVQTEGKTGNGLGKTMPYVNESTIKYLKVPYSAFPFLLFILNSSEAASHD